MQVADPNRLRKRLVRVRNGEIKSAFDEFLSQRIPIQLGGMSDPFTAMEKKERTTLEFIRVLSDAKYPFVVSTKSDLIAENAYLEVLQDANVYVRFSTTVIDETSKANIDVGCPNTDQILAAASRLAARGIPVSFRFQPIIPGFENEGHRLIDLAASAGVRHISAEYLKVAIDAGSRFGPVLSALLNDNPISFYKSLGARRQGHEYILPLEYRARHLPALYKHAHEKGLTFGFADNDLLLHSDGDSCCGASNLYLNDSKFFRTNIVGLAKSKDIGAEIRFNEFTDLWSPKFPVSTYLNSKSRIGLTKPGQSDWASHLLRLWEVDQGYSPDYFDGIVRMNKIDEQGRRIFQRVRSEFAQYLE